MTRYSEPFLQRVYKNFYEFIGVTSASYIRDISKNWFHILKAWINP